MLIATLWQLANRSWWAYTYVHSRINQSIATDCRTFQPRRPLSTVYKTVQEFCLNVLQSVVIDWLILLCTYVRTYLLITIYSPHASTAHTQQDMLVQLTPSRTEYQQAQLCTACYPTTPCIILWVNTRSSILRSWEVGQANYRLIIFLWFWCAETSFSSIFFLRFSLSSLVFNNAFLLPINAP